MDLSDVRGKSYPQKVTLESNIVTVNGELISKGTNIYVLLCEKLIQCTDCKNCSNVELVGSHRHRKIYINPESEEDFLDIHCCNKIYHTLDELCHDRPRYFSCTKAFFAVDQDEQTVRVEEGKQFELQTIQGMNTYSEGTAQSSQKRSYTNVVAKTANIVNCRCLESGIEVQILSSTCKSAFQSLEDLTFYRLIELVERFSLPRHVKINDTSIFESAKETFGLTHLILESQTKTFFLLFTLDYIESEQAPDIQIKDKIKCCELIDPSTVHIQRRIDNKFIGELFDPLFLIEVEQSGRQMFSVLGRKTNRPVSRLRTGRETYMAMDVEEKQDHSPLCDSGFAEADRGSVFSVTKTSANISHHSLSIVDNIDNSKRLPNLEPYLSVVPGENLSSSHDFGDYVDITLDYEKTPPLPKRLYRENEYISDQNPESPQITSVKVVTETEIYVREQPIEVPRERSNDSKQNSIPNETHDLTKPECELKSITFPGILHKSSDNSKQETIESTEIKKPEYEPGCTTTVGILHNSSDNSDKKTIKSTEIKPEFELKCMTTTELAELLKTCKLEKFANVCIEEVIDGDLFLSLTDDILQEEPFKLKKLDILKVNKIRDGWRPK